MELTSGWPSGPLRQRAEWRVQAPLPSGRHFLGQRLGIGEIIGLHGLPGLTQQVVATDQVGGWRGFACIVDKDGVVRFRKEYAPGTIPDPMDILAEVEKLG